MTVKTRPFVLENLEPRQMLHANIAASPLVHEPMTQIEVNGDLSEYTQTGTGCFHDWSSSSHRCEGIADGIFHAEAAPMDSPVFAHNGIPQEISSSKLGLNDPGTPTRFLALDKGWFAAFTGNAVDVAERLTEHESEMTRVADVNGDGRDDLTFSYFDPLRGLIVRSTLADVDGTWTNAQHVLTDGEMIGPEVADVNADGRDDLVFHYFDSVKGLVVRSMLSNGDGMWTRVQHVLTDGEMLGPEVADVNADGRDDLVFHYFDHAKGLVVRSMLANGDGTWTRVQHVLTDGEMIGPEVADVNADGRDDLVFHYFDHAKGLVVRSMLSNGDGMWTRVQHVLTDGNMLGPEVADVNADERDDLVFHYSDSVQGIIVRTMLSNGDGTWTRMQHVLGNDDLIGPEVIDVNGDARDDLVFYAFPSSDALTVHAYFSSDDGKWERQPGLLDPRRLGSATVILSPHGTLRIDASPFGGKLEVGFHSGQIRVSSIDGQNETESTSFPLSHVRELSFYGSDKRDEFHNRTNIVDSLFGYGGDDILRGGSSKSMILGGDGHDELQGGHGDDTIHGGGGFDEIDGGHGNDKVFGDTTAWNDGDLPLDLTDRPNHPTDGYLFEWNGPVPVQDPDERGNNATDMTSGIVLPGFDRSGGSPETGELEGLSIQGHRWQAVDQALEPSPSRREILRGGPGDDTIYGSAVDDEIHGDDGDDTLFGDDGKDEIYGGNGDDTARGGASDDRILGEGGNDNLSGNDGDDTIYGERPLVLSDLDINGIGAGFGFVASSLDLQWPDGIQATRFETRGRDVIRGGPGRDTIHGGSDDDEIHGGGGDDVVCGDEGGDEIRGDDGNDELHGGDGDDKITGGRHDDNIYGGRGGDEIGGDDGYDELFGGDGGDTIAGGPHDDTIHGEGGNDFLTGGRGGDTIHGGSGNDELYGDHEDPNSFVDAGEDKLYGDAGSDYIHSGPTDNDTLEGGAGDDQVVTAAPLRVMTYNVQMFPELAHEILEFFGKPLNSLCCADYRAERIANELTQFDVIGFQEAFDEGNRNQLRDGVLQNWFGPDWKSKKTQHVVGPPGTENLLTGSIDGGLALLSRYPIVEQNKHVFGPRTGDDKRADKGVIHARIRRAPGQYADIYVTHLQAVSDDERKNMEQKYIRSLQYTELSNFIEYTSGRGNPVILMGDLNTDGAHVTKDTSYTELENCLRRDTCREHPNPTMEIGQFPDNPEPVNFIDTWVQLRPNHRGITNAPLCHRHDESADDKPKECNPQDYKRLDHIWLANPREEFSLQHPLIARDIRVEPYRRAFLTAKAIQTLESAHDNVRKQSLSDHSAVQAEFVWFHYIHESNAVDDDNVTRGVRFEYFEGDGWSQMPSFRSLSADRTGNITNDAWLDIQHRKDRFAVRYTGYVHVPGTGEYVFHVASDNGSRLYIDHELVVDNDGDHPLREHDGAVFLEAGFHAMEIQYYENRGSESLELSWSGPSFLRTTLLPQDLFRPIDVT